MTAISVAMINTTVASSVGTLTVLRSNQAATWSICCPSFLRALGPCFSSLEMRHERLHSKTPLTHQGFARTRSWRDGRGANWQSSLRVGEIEPAKPMGEEAR